MLLVPYILRGGPFTLAHSTSKNLDSGQIQVGQIAYNVKIIRFFSSWIIQVRLNSCQNRIRTIKI